jgi:hypothetical protein
MFHLGHNLKTYSPKACHEYYLMSSETACTFHHVQAERGLLAGNDRGVQVHHYMQRLSSDVAPFD